MLIIELEQIQLFVLFRISPQLDWTILGTFGLTPVHAPHVTAYTVQCSK